jgi:uncharacterized protein
MQRDYLAKLLIWKDKKGRKPLIINGARQVGKTWLMKEFGRQNFEQTAYINFEVSINMIAVLQQGYDIPTILNAIEIETNIKPIAGKTLIIFDEIQLAPQAITSLKYFYENAKQYHVVAAGSLLGVALAQKSSFPVGKVEFMDVFPFSFLEFINAINEIELHKILIESNWILINAFKNKLQNILRLYYYIGGMPEVIANYIQEQSLEKVREIQQNILRTYEIDFSKHAPTNIVPRIRMLWQNIPVQLGKENKKFLYKAVKEGARARDYELALHWLIDAGMVHKVCNVNAIQVPLKAYENTEAFKLYILDVGLMGAMVNLDAQAILQQNQNLLNFKGALTEQYVLQQLIIQTKLYYWAPSNVQAEVDFIFEKGSLIWPLEVKAEENLQAKSLSVYFKKFAPKYAIRTSMSNYRKNEWLVNIPLLNIGNLIKMLE